ncbi:MAG: cobaltochelatase subunit CobN [Gemmatimonadales bacterium]|nr:cobaltochelatase subunit CobN [Gemmatimonadales bacterium]
MDRWRALPPDAAAEREALVDTIQAQAAQLDLVPAAPGWNGSGPQEVEQLRGRLAEIEQSLIPTGLHVVGQPPSDDERRDLLELVAEAGAPPEERVRVERCLRDDPEIPALLHALDGGFVSPVPGGDLLRTPAIVPTGRNIYGFDPFRMPTPFAVADGRRQADALLARHVATHGSLPETVAIVLWGTDNMKSEGAPLAQALALLGARPRIDYLGRLTGAELVPLAELGRPRIDVLVTLSGIFRDLLPLQVKLLAEAALLAASADEPLEQNLVRAHALAHMSALGCDLETAALRVFSNAEGAYGSNVNHLVDSGTWQDDGELAETFVRRKGFAYGAGGRAVAQPRLFERAIAGASCAYQNLDSVEYGVTDLDHYYDSLGAIAKVAETRGASVRVYVGDQTRGTHLVRTIDEQVALESRTRLLNPRWYEGMLKHGYEGVRLIETQVSNTFGWSATTDAVPGWVYTRTTETFVLDAEMRARLAALNPHAVVKLSHRLLEAHDRGFWQPDEDTLAALRDASADLEDRLEGVLT